MLKKQLEGILTIRSPKAYDDIVTILTNGKFEQNRRRVTHDWQGRESPSLLVENVKRPAIRNVPCYPILCLPWVTE